MVSEIGPQTDLYAVGCILYQMLTGVVPFEHLIAEGRTHALENRRPRQAVGEEIQRGPRLLVRAPEDRGEEEQHENHDDSLLFVAREATGQKDVAKIQHRCPDEYVGHRLGNGRRAHREDTRGHQRDRKHEHTEADGQRELACRTGSGSRVGCRPIVPSVFGALTV